MRVAREVKKKKRASFVIIKTMILVVKVRGVVQNNNPMTKRIRIAD